VLSNTDRLYVYSVGLRHGDNVVICCTAGLGRSGLLAACILIACGKYVANKLHTANLFSIHEHSMSSDQAIDIVRKVRGTYRAIERKVQERTVELYAQGQV
jgi:protein tyrosine/serine phosphatase